MNLSLPKLSLHVALTSRLRRSEVEIVVEVFES